MKDNASSLDQVAAPPSRADSLPLTARQSLVWADEQILAETRYHHWVLVGTLGGPLDVVKLRHAITETRKSHDALDLVVDTRIPRQRYASGPQDLREIVLPAGVALDQWVAEQSCREFDRSSPPWDAALVTTAEDEHAFVFRSHYVVCDEHSLALFAREVSERYQDITPKAPGRFRDFLVAQGLPEHRLRAERDTRDWQEHLKDPPPAATLLGCTRGGDGVSTTRVVREMSIDDSRALRASTLNLSPTSGAGPGALEDVFTTIVLTWLYRVSGQRELIVAAPLNARERIYENSIGLISEPTYLRIEFADMDTFQSLFAKVDAARQFARQHASASLGSVESTAFVGAVPDCPATFCGREVKWRIGNAPVWSKVGLGTGDSRDNLSVRYMNSGDSFTLLFDFNDDTYTPAARERLVEYFLRFLKAYLNDSTQCLNRIEWLADDEKASLRAMGQGRQPPPAPDLLAAFARVVRETPNKTAVEFRDQGISYADFDRATNRIARQLTSLGVKRDSRVAVAMPRGFGEIAALLATLKAGGAYVPVDPSHPVERVRVILEDAEPQVLVAPDASPLRAALPEGVHWLKLDDPLAGGSEVDDVPLEDGADGESLAYILFTSGSTGRPKGVEIPRQAFANFLQSMAAEPGLKSDDRVIAITTTTFDIAGLELFLPLYVGATVVVADRDTASDPLRLRAMLEHANISLMQATPATWRLLLDAGWTGHPELRMLCGGEAMSLALAHRLSSCGNELWNVYGPTETTVWSTLELIPRDVTRITIGHPIDHTQIELRDPEGRLVPLGTIGEICIGGRGLARGYRERPDLTADRFPIDGETGTRYYRTGDLGRYLPDGRLECLGRVDHQVKVRGFRIEPADIEAQLRSVEGVQEVLVIARASGDGDPQLVAYWVGGASRDLLHERAKDRLPYYMVPSAYVHLSMFPLTTSGKIDRKQLPAPEEQSAEENVGVAPRNDQESLVASIWREVLGISFVPVDKDFFSLGGTSIRAIQMRSKLHSAFGVNIPLKALFEKPTVEAIVAQLGSPESEDSPVVTWLARGTNPIPWIGLMGIQLFEDIARALPSDQSLLAMHVPVRYVPDRDPFPTVAELATKYVRVIKEYQPNGPYYLLGLCHGGVVAFEAAAQLEEAGDTVAVVALLDAELPAARRTRLGLRLQRLAQELVAEPRATLLRVLSTAERRVPILKQWRAKSRSAPTEVGRDPVDIPFDGPEIDADLVRYEALGRRVQCRVDAFRATKSDLPSWIEVSPDLGWAGRSSRLVCHDIPASHLGIVRPPFASQVAEVLCGSRGTPRLD